MATHGRSQEVRSSSLLRGKASKSLETQPMGYDRLRAKIAAHFVDDLGLNLDQDVRQYRDIPGKRIMRYRVRRVVTPFEFYLEYINLPEPRLFSTWFEEMQEFYDNKENRRRLQLFHGIVIPGRCYACHDSEDGKWHRVRVHEVRNTHGSVTMSVMVFYLDLCKLLEVKVEKLLELDPAFAEAPAQVFRCYLEDIHPVGVSGMKWSDEALRYFNELVKGKEYVGIALTRSTTIVSHAMPDFFTNLGVVLAETIPGTWVPNPDLCLLNARMVDAGFAEAIGVCGGCRHAVEIQGYVPSFDHTEFDRLHGLPITNGVKEESVPVVSEAADELEGGECASTEPKEDDLKEITKSYNGMKLDKIDALGPNDFYNNTTEKFPVEFASRVAAVNLVYVSSPSFIIIHLRSKLDEFNAMQERIRVMAQNGEDLTNGHPGMFVACNILNKELASAKRASRGQDSIWCRGIIKDVEFSPKIEYKVLLVDYGNEIVLDEGFVRLLPEIFQEIPSFAIRIHIDAEFLQPIPSTGWNLSVEMDFRKYVYCWEDQNPHYFVYRPGHAKILELNHFLHKVGYSPVDGKWFAVSGTMTKAHGNQILHDMKDHPMLHSLFKSIGVELYYEIRLRHSPVWNFETILDSLTCHGGAQRTAARKESWRRHHEIIEATIQEVERRMAEINESLRQRNRPVVKNLPETRRTMVRLKFA